MAGLLIFAEESAAEECRQWYVKFSKILKLYMSSRKKNLVDVVRLIWKIDALDDAMKQNFTLHALNRLKKEKATALCQFLLKENDNLWVKDTLSPFEGASGEPPNEGYKSTAELVLESWFPAGVFEECRLCGCRSPKKWGFLKDFYHLFRSCYGFTLRCDICEYRARDRGLVQRSNLNLNEENIV